MIAPTDNRILWLPGESRMWDDEPSSRSNAGVRIDESNAHQVAAVFACLRVIAETVAGLPLHVLERTAGGGKRIARELPLYRQLHSQPNGWQTSFEWREQSVFHVGLWGDAFDELKAGQIVPLHPSRMKVERIENGKLRYKYREDKGTETVYADDAILQIRGPSDDGVNGMSVVAECKDAIALARACELHGARFFAAGARPGFVLSTEGQLNAEAREALRSQWDRRHGGVGNSHNTAVLTGGLKPYDIPQSSNSDSQFIELRRYQLEEIARLFRVPGSLLGIAPSTPDGDIAFVTHCIMPWLRRFESAFMRDLIADDDRYLVEFDVRGLLRGDAASRSAYYRAMWDIGVVSTNDIRATENLDPVEGGDVRYRPLNMGTLGEQPSEGDVLAQQQPGSEIDGQAVEGGLAAAAGEPVVPATPGEPVEPEAPQVADVSLNGAQITGLIAIIQSVVDGLVNRDGAAAMVAAAFPSMNTAQIAAILAGVVERQPAPAADPAQPPQAEPMPTAPAGRSLRGSSRDCGTGAGGFKPGNKCAPGGGEGGGDAGAGGGSAGGGGTIEGGGQSAYQSHSEITESHKTQAKTLAAGIKNKYARGLAEEAYAQAIANGDAVPAIQSHTFKGYKAAAMYSQSNDRIYVNSTITASSEASFRKAVESGFLSQANPVLHELGHKAHADAAGTSYDTAKNHSFSASQKAKIESAVSRYAATNGLEFVAEVHAGVSAGKQYDEEIMTMFRTVTRDRVKLRGPSK